MKQTRRKKDKRKSDRQRQIEREIEEYLDCRSEGERHKKRENVVEYLHNLHGR
jgi:hypothetical protein